jgi:hypothetical protein
MNPDKLIYMQKERLSENDQKLIHTIKADLNDLDKESVDVDGNSLKPSQCYRIGLDPLHVLFNTNCPDDLKKKVEAILSKYAFPDEDLEY